KNIHKKSPNTQARKKTLIDLQKVAEAYDISVGKKILFLFIQKFKNQQRLIRPTKPHLSQN
ncbi:MAG: hypothetical protein ACK5TA_08725, partial [bacterium]